MPFANQTDLKLEMLRQCGTLNPYPARVKSVLFQKDAFFDPRDLVQVKYEMLRCVEQEAYSVEQASANFGFSRMSWYHIEARYDIGGMVGLLPQRRGPKMASKKRTYSQAMTNSSVKP